MASIRKRAPWRVTIAGEADTEGPFASLKQATDRAKTLEAEGAFDVQVLQDGKGAWEARVRRHGGKDLVKTFRTKALAEKWAVKEEGKIVEGTFIDTSAADKTTVGELFQRFADSLTTAADSGDSDRYRLGAFQRLDFAALKVSALRTHHIAAFRDAELKRGLKPTSVIRNLQLMTRVFNVAHREWGVRMPLNPASGKEVSRPDPGPDAERNRTLAGVHLIPSAEEVGRRLAAVSGKVRLKTYEQRLAGWHRQGVRLDFHPEVAPLLKSRVTEYCALARAARYPHWFEPSPVGETYRPLVVVGRKARDRSSKCRIWAIESFGIETAMRRGEMAKLEWSHVDLDLGCLHLPGSITKNKRSRCVPLTIRAVRILRTQPRESALVFNTTVQSIKRAHKLVIARSGAHNLRFHDLRHEATTRLVQGTNLSPLLIGQITGHRDQRMLMRYYNPTPQQIVATFRASRR